MNNYWALYDYVIYITEINETVRLVPYGFIQKINNISYLSLAYENSLCVSQYCLYAKSDDIPDHGMFNLCAKWHFCCRDNNNFIYNAPILDNIFIKNKKTNELIHYRWLFHQ